MDASAAILARRERQFDQSAGSKTVVDGELGNRTAVACWREYRGYSMEDPVEDATDGPTHLDAAAEMTAVRCPRRFADLKSAQEQCLRTRKCGGITMDGGLLCGHKAVQRYELRGRMMDCSSMSHPYSGSR